MRRAQVYRWQIPMDAGVVLRERRLKTRDGFFMHLRQDEREGWGEIAPLPGFSLETPDEAQAALMARTHAARGSRSGAAGRSFRRVRHQLRAGRAGRQFAGRGELLRRAALYRRSG